MIRRFLRYAEDCYLWSAILVVLRPAARFLPERVSSKLPGLIAWSLLVVTPRGRRAERGFTQSFPDHPLGPRRVAVSWLARPYFDYLEIERSLKVGSAERVPADRLDVRIPEVTRDLLDGSSSVIFAAAHFNRFALMHSFYRRGMFSRDFCTVIAPTPTGRTWFAEERAKEVFGQLVRFVAQEHPEDPLPASGGSKAMIQLVKAASGAGWAANIHVDAPTTGSPPRSFSRPFAGHEARTFMTGTARIARMTQLPIVLALAHEASGRIVLTLSEPLPPADVGDDSSDRAVTSRLLDEIERHVGRYPDQYVLDVGRDRRWDAVADRWVSRVG